MDKFHAFILCMLQMEQLNCYFRNNFPSVRNKLKTKIKSTKSNFYRKALSGKKSSEVWKVIHKILNPNGKRIWINANELNKHFSTKSKRLTGRNNADLHVLKYIINNMSPSLVNKPSYDPHPIKKLYKKWKVYATTALLVLTTYL